MVILLSRSQKVTLSASVPVFCWLGSCGGALVSWIGMMLLSLSRVSQARMAPLASPVAVAGGFGSALGSALLTRTSVMIEHSKETFSRRSSGLDVLIVAVSTDCGVFGSSTWTWPPAATALLAGWALLVPSAAGTAMAIVPARPAAMTTRGENRGMPAPSLRAGTREGRAQVWTSGATIRNGVGHSFWPHPEIRSVTTGGRNVTNQREELVAYCLSKPGAW